MHKLRSYVQNLGTACYPASARGRKCLALGLLALVTVLGLFPCFQFVPPASLSSNKILTTATPQQPHSADGSIPPRDQVVWAVGLGNSPTDFNPYSMNPAYGVSFMYEPLFGRNYATGQNGALIPVIGTSMTWSPDGMSLTITLNPSAKWSDGVPVNADDVVYSYTVAMNNATTFATGVPMNTRIASVAAADSETVVFTMQPGYPYDSYVDTWMTTNVNIIPKHVWTDIMTQLVINGTNFPNFYNDWFDPSFPAAWKVCSGPYVPYYRNITNYDEVYQLRSDWWGSGVIYTDLPVTGGVPQVPFIGCKHFSSNAEQDAALMNGDVDWFGGYYDSVWNLFATHPEIYGWYGHAAPYFPAMGMSLALDFNLTLYPFNQTWFRQALAEAVNYTHGSDVSASGYYQHLPLGYVNPNVPTLAGFYNASIYNLPLPGVTTPGITLNIPAAGNLSATLAILSQHCTQLGNGSWQVTDGSAPAVNYVLGYSPLYQGSTPVTFPGMAGSQPFTIMCETGWSDVVDVMQDTASTWTALGLPVTIWTAPFYSPFADYVLNGSIAMAIGGLSLPRLLNTPLTFFSGFVGAHTGWDTNTSAWQGPAANQFAADFQAFETTVPGSAAQLALASDMQLQLARGIPSIPFVSTGYWYLFNTKYWVGWATTANEYQQVCASYEMQYEAVKVREILALHPLVINAPQITGPSTMSVNHESANNFLNLTITDDFTCFPTYTAYANGTVWGTPDQSWKDGQNISVDLNTLPGGYYNITIIAQDGLGSQASHQVMVWANLWIVGVPEVAIPYMSIHNNLSWTIFGDATSSPVYTVYKNGTAWGVPGQAWSSGVPVNVNVDGLPLGDYNFTIVAQNGLGFDGTNQVFLHVVPDTAPTIAASSSVTITYGTANNYLNWTILDNSTQNPTYTVYKNGTMWGVANQVWSASVNVSVQVDGLAVGRYNFTIVAQDGLGLNASHQVLLMVYYPTTNGTWQVLMSGNQVINCAEKLSLFAEFMVNTTIGGAHINVTAYSIYPILKSLAQGIVYFAVTLTGSVSIKGLTPAKFYFDPKSLPAGVDASKLAVYIYADGAWALYNDGGQVDLASHYISMNISFTQGVTTIFAIAVKPSPEPSPIPWWPWVPIVIGIIGIVVICGAGASIASKKKKVVPQAEDLPWA